MRMSRGITLTLLSGLMLTACLTTGGCRGSADRTWYDAQGHAVAETWKTDADGKQIPDPHPYDRYGRQWVYDANGNLMPLPPPSKPHYHSTAWLWGGSGYRSTSSGTSYRSSSSSSSSTTSSSISRGGFGSTGIGMSGG
ncbi:MAG: hypothetical protein C0467_27485 [Planctomycetaceae bacterium]|nr:hypothetical protein [Planctomycetaceae bacterium]